MEKLFSWLIDSLVSVSAKKVPLSLKEIGRKSFAPVTIVIKKCTAECRQRDSELDRGCDHFPPCRLGFVNSGKEGLSYSITAIQNEAIQQKIEEIAEQAWNIGTDADGMKTGYSVAQTDYAFIGKKKPCRLVVKREKKDSQLDMFDPSEYRYWAILTNLPSESYNANQVILTHQMRGQMEKSIGELKHHCGLDHLPCGQFSANAMYFTIGVLAANLLQLLKQDTFFDDYLKASIKTFRYKLIHLPARVIKHGRVLFIKIVSSLEKFKLIESVYLKYSLSPPLS